MFFFISTFFSCQPTPVDIFLSCGKGQQQLNSYNMPFPSLFYHTSWIKHLFSTNIQPCTCFLFLLTCPYHTRSLKTHLQQNRFTIFRYTYKNSSWFYVDCWVGVYVYWWTAYMIKRKYERKEDICKPYLWMSVTEWKS